MWWREWIKSPLKEEATGLNTGSYALDVREERVVALKVTGVVYGSKSPQGSLGFGREVFYAVPKKGVFSKRITFYIPQENHRTGDESVFSIEVSENKFRKKRYRWAWMEKDGGTAIATGTIEKKDDGQWLWCGVMNAKKKEVAKRLWEQKNEFELSRRTSWWNRDKGNESNKEILPETPEEDQRRWGDLLGWERLSVMFESGEKNLGERIESELHNVGRGLGVGLVKVWCNAMKELDGVAGLRELREIKECDFKYGLWTFKKSEKELQWIPREEGSEEGLGVLKIDGKSILTVGSGACSKIATQRESLEKALQQEEGVNLNEKPVIKRESVRRRL